VFRQPKEMKEPQIITKSLYNYVLHKYMCLLVCTWMKN
jgi:hypothetical protein